MNEILKIAGASITSAMIGFGIGYKLLEKRLGEAFDERLEKETASMREFYSTVKKPYSTPEEAVKDLIPPSPASEPEDPRQKALKTAYHKVVKGQGYVEATADEVEGALAAEEELELPVHNIFEQSRDVTKPYIVTQDEFMQNDPNHEQNTLTFFLTGEVMVDDHDKIVDNVETLVGTQFKHNFGNGSSDPKIVHVRNEAIGMDFEIICSERSYEQDVLGISENPETPRERVRRESS